MSTGQYPITSLGFTYSDFLFKSSYLSTLTSVREEILTRVTETRVGREGFKNQKLFTLFLNIQIEKKRRFGIYKLS
jgi:hypothetical protein